MQDRGGESVLAVLHQDVRKLALHRGVGRRNEQAEPPPVAARLGMTVGQLRWIKKHGRLAVVDRT